MIWRRARHFPKPAYKKFSFNSVYKKFQNNGNKGIQYVCMVHNIVISIPGPHTVQYNSYSRFLDHAYVVINILENIVYIIACKGALAPTYTY